LLLVSSSSEYFFKESNMKVEQISIH